MVVYAVRQGEEFDFTFFEQNNPPSQKINCLAD